jgi:hypothetical protein
VPWQLVVHTVHYLGAWQNFMEKSVCRFSFMLQKSKKCRWQFFHVAKIKKVSVAILSCCKKQRSVCNFHAMLHAAKSKNFLPKSNSHAAWQISLTNLIDKFHAAKGKEVFAIFVSAIFQKAILRSSKEVKSQFKMSVSLSKLRTLKGLENNNNTCWIISLLQSLSYLESFTSFFDSFTVKDSGPNCILRLVQNLMNSFRDSKNTNTVLSASGIISILLSKYPDNFQKNRHEDVSEAFLCLLEAMNKDLMTKVVIKNENGFKFDQSFDNVFGFTMKCFSVCPRQDCSYKGENTELFTTLYLFLIMS